MNKILLSQQKINSLKKELKQLESTVLRHHEDEHENIKMSIREAASYDVVIGSKQAKVGKLKNILKNAEILPDKVESEKVVLGSWVELQDKESNTQKYRLVDPFEADPSKNLLSVESPLGKVLLKKKKGDRIFFNDKKFEIITIT